MPIYEYETIPAREGETPKRYEIRQCMSDEPLSVHPETGEAIRRVFSTFSTGGGSSGGDSCCCGQGGGHHHHGGCGCGCGM